MSSERRLSDCRECYIIYRVVAVLGLFLWLWILWTAIDTTAFYVQTHRSGYTYYQGQCVSFRTQIYYKRQDTWAFELDNGFSFEMTKNKKTDFDDENFSQIMSNELCYVFYMDKKGELCIIGIRDGENRLINEQYLERELDNDVFIKWFFVFMALAIPIAPLLASKYYLNEYKILLNKLSAAKNNQ